MNGKNKKKKKNKDQVVFMHSEIISHCDHKFEQMMKLDGITKENIMKSLNIEDNISSVLQAGEGVGQSGSFFFFSKDKRLLIKTLRGSEKKLLLDMLDDLIAHFKKTNNESLLARIYGVFTI